MDTTAPQHRSGHILKDHHRIVVESLSCLQQCWHVGSTLAKSWRLFAVRSSSMVPCQLDSEMFEMLLSGRRKAEAITVYLPCDNLEHLREKTSNQRLFQRRPSKVQKCHRHRTSLCPLGTMRTRTVDKLYGQAGGGMRTAHVDQHCPFVSLPNQTWDTCKWTIDAPITLIILNATQENQLT